MAITQAAEAVHAVNPGQLAAAADAVAPQRACRELRRTIGAVSIGPLLLIASFVIPEGSTNLDPRLRWMGAAYTALSLFIGYSLFRKMSQRPR